MLHGRRDHNNTRNPKEAVKFFVDVGNADVLVDLQKCLRGVGSVEVLSFVVEFRTNSSLRLTCFHYDTFLIRVTCMEDRACSSE